MLGKLCLLLALLGYTFSSPVPEDSCLDGQGVFIVGSYMPCSMLVDADDPRNAIYGLFNARTALCAAENHDCCSTCSQILDQGGESKDTVTVAAKDNCVDVAYSIQIADGSYNCGYLLDLDLPNNQMLGIYQDRVNICTQGVHQCCQACRTVLSQDKATSSNNEKSTDTGTDSTKTNIEKTQTKPSNSDLLETVSTVTEDNCVDVAYSIQIADGSYNCGYLLDLDLPNNQMLGIYQDRVNICTQGVHQCCQACRTVLSQQVKATSPASQPDSTSTSKPVTTLTTTSAPVNTVTTTETPTSGEPKPGYTVQVNNGDSDSGYQLKAMEERVQQKVDELQHEVDVLFASFEDANNGTLGL